MDLLDLEASSQPTLAGSGSSITTPKVEAIGIVI